MSIMREHRRFKGCARPVRVAVVVFTTLATAGCAGHYGYNPGETKAAPKAPSKTSHAASPDLTQESPYQGYLQAHQGVRNPFPPLGGVTTVTLQQTRGDVEVALPAKRRLDPNVFGTPDMPRAYGGTPIAEGIPPRMRNSENRHYTQLEQMTPFGPANMIMTHGTLKATLVDGTATDAARTKDSVQFDASWQDQDGNVYEVRCRRVYPHGELTGHPTFGGVLLNHLMHGSSRVGTPLMPTLFCYAAFWGSGEVLKNGKVMDHNRLVHGMLTEDVRGKDYTLDFDRQVTPTRLVFHLIVPPMKGGKPAPLDTGYNLTNGKQLPFWHVMFTNFRTKAAHQQMTASFPQRTQHARR